MPLPKLAIPEYECTLPVTGLKVKYRPFLVKEEKLLYLAMESQQEKEMVNAVKTIIKNCTDLKKNLDKLPTFEIEYICRISKLPFLRTTQHTLILTARSKWR